MTCKKCEAIEERKGDILYSDPYSHAVLPSRPAKKGHIRIYSKKHVEKIEELEEEEFEHLLQVANLSSTVLFESLGAQGTNIIFKDGKGHLYVDVVARTEDDGINLRWEPQKLGDMEDVQKRISDHAIIETDTPGKNEPKLEKTKEKLDSDNPMIKQLQKLP